MPMVSNRIRTTAAALAVILALVDVAIAQDAIDLADPVNGDMWFRHPVIGDVSYDAFVRAGNNPIYVGSPPYEWPVNGLLFQDRPSGDLYCFISLYPRGYCPAGPERLMRSRDSGAHWEDSGIILKGDPYSFDGDGKQGGATLDASVVQDESDYHMVYSWTTPDNKDGGLAYAFARAPVGPWTRDPRPICAESAQPMIPPGYKRIYAGSLIKRAKDWLIIADMSTPMNVGGTWASICMTAPTARGPYSKPVFLRIPQGGHWLPQPIEFFPAFVHDGYVYASHTSIARNRGYQIIFRAKIEEAHRPEAWSLWQEGSAFHAEPNEWEHHGIWGQTLAGFVGQDGFWRIMYPARNSRDCGTINIASRPWAQPYQKGFWLTGPNAPSMGLVLRQFQDFRLDAEYEVSGPSRVVWNFRGPLGPDISTANAAVSALSWRDMTSLAFKDNHWQLDRITSDGVSTRLAGGGLPDRSTKHRVTVEQHGGTVRVRHDGVDLCNIEAPAASGGAIGLVAETGTCIRAKRFTISSAGAPGSWFLLPMEGLLNAGNTQTGWTEKKQGFKYGPGFVGTFEGARAKWSFRGRRARLWAPRGRDYGQVDVYLDDVRIKRLDLHADQDVESTAVWESGQLSPANHAVMTVRASGALPVDCLEFWPL